MTLTAGALLALAGARCDLGFDAARVQRVLDPAEGDARRGEVVDLFARLGEAPRDDGRVVVISVIGVPAAGRPRGELLVRAPGAITMVTPRALLPLPRLVTAHAPFLAAVATFDDAPEPALDAARHGDAARPLFLVAPEAIL